MGRNDNISWLRECLENENVWCKMYKIKYISDTCFEKPEIIPFNGERGQFLVLTIDETTTNDFWEMWVEIHITDTRKYLVLKRLD